MGAETCLFYESKCTDQWLMFVKYLLKDYIELRVYITKIPEVRLSPDLQSNLQLMSLLENFHASVVAATPALEFAAFLPKITHNKMENWMTKKVLLPDLGYVPATAHLD